MDLFMLLLSSTFPVSTCLVHLRLYSVSHRGHFCMRIELTPRIRLRFESSRQSVLYKHNTATIPSKHIWKCLSFNFDAVCKDCNYQTWRLFVPGSPSAPYCIVFLSLHILFLIYGDVWSLFIFYFALFYGSWTLTGHSMNKDRSTWFCTSWLIRSLAQRRAVRWHRSRSKDSRYLFLTDVMSCWSLTSLVSGTSRFLFIYCMAPWKNFSAGAKYC